MAASKSLQGGTSANLSEVWAHLSEGLNKVFSLKSIDRKQWMTMHTIIYDYCVALNSKHNSEILNTQRGQAWQRVQSQNGNDNNALAGKEIHEKFKIYFENHLVAVKAKSKEFTSDADLLKFYCREWNDYKFSAKVVNGIASYINRYWLMRQTAAGRLAYDIFTLAIIVWRDEFFKSVSERLCKAFFVQIQVDRDGGASFDSSLLRSLLESLLAMGVSNDNSSQDQNLDIYKESIEEHYITTTRTYYLEKTKEYFSSHNFSEYLNWVEKKISEEEARIEKYLHKSSEGVIIEELNRTMIRDHLNLFYSEFRVLVSNTAIPQLRRLYQLMSRLKPEVVPPAVTVNTLMLPLHDAFEQDIYVAGMQGIQDLGEVVIKEPKLFIDEVLSKHRHYTSIVDQSFNKNVNFGRVLDTAFKKFINKNAISEKHGQTRISTMLALYYDSILRRSNKAGDAMGYDDGNCQTVLSEALIIFSLLDDKDCFQLSYSRFLARRMISQTGLNEELEEFMVNKLREMCGFEYTSKMSRLLSDEKTSRGINLSFKESLVNAMPPGHPAANDHMYKQSPLSLDLKVTVVRQGAWPLNQCEPFTYPPALHDPMVRYTSHYESQHNGRKLVWLPSVSRGEVAATCFKTNHIFMANTYQIVILIMFNTTDTLSVDQVVSATGIKDELVLTTFQQLANNNIVKAVTAADTLPDSPTPPNGEATLPNKGDMALPASPPAEPNPDDAPLSADPAKSPKNSMGDRRCSVNASFTLNLGFTNKKTRINVWCQPKTDTKQEQEQSDKSVTDDRKHSIQACIVRVMKARKTLKHPDLLQEVIQLQSSRFTPEIPVIKRCIDILIEKEYIRRSAKDKAVYEYMA